ncbi:MAG: hypothetical protein ACOYO9_08000 [Candidatus Nanopelagicales bacterium]
MPVTRVTASMLLASIFVLGVAFSAPMARAAGSIDSAAAELRGGASVYVDPMAELPLTSADAAALSSRISATGLPIFIAVLPSSAGADPGAVLVDLKDAVGIGGIYGVVVGNDLRAGSTTGSVSGLATAAFRAQKDNGLAAVLTEFVGLADAEFNGASPTSSNEGGGAGETTFLLVLFVGAMVVLVIVVIRRRRRQALQLAQVRRAIDEDVTEYGERLARFDLRSNTLDEAGRDDLQRALDDYESAKMSVVTMRTPGDAAAITGSLEDGRFAVACLEARADGRPLPERRAPCFVDPRHGPSVGDVEWQAPGLTTREVPMCAACRTDVETGGSPAAREVDGPAGRQPYWQAGPQYAPYAQGYYSPFGNVMTAVMMGTMISSMWSMPGITSGASGVDSAGIGGGGSDGWGFGGGGGGDFGGGDFGGGDFGGGGDF